MILILCREVTNDTYYLSIELEKRGHKVITAQPEQITINCNTDKITIYTNNQIINPFCVLGWVSLHQRKMGLPLLEAIEIAGVPIINNAQTLRIGGNKFLSSCIFTKLNIPHINTEVVLSKNSIDAISKRIGMPLVFKPTVGAKGEDVILINSIEQLYDVANKFFNQGDPIYLQSVIKKPERDIRITVINFKVHSAFYRTLGTGGFVTNLSKGGDWIPCNPDEEMVLLAEKTAIAINAPIAGVDIIEDMDTNQLRVVEVNVTPSITKPMPSVVYPVSDLFNKYL